MAICLLQHPRVAGVGDRRWDDNDRLIAAARNYLPELLRLARIGLVQEQLDPGSRSR